MVTPAPLRHSLAPYEAYPLQDLLGRTAKRLPNKVAVIDGERRFTYRQLDDYSGRFAAALAGLGISKGDPVGILAPNCAEFVIAFYGIVKAGAVVTTVNTGYREREIAHQLNDSGAEVLVVHADFKHTAEAARDATPALGRLIVIEPTSEDLDSFWGLLENAPATPPSVVIDPKNELAVLPYSSGTTGLPKGVMLTHFNLTANVSQLIDRKKEVAAPRESDVILVHLPLFHIYGMNILNEWGHRRRSNPGDDGPLRHRSLP